MCQHRSASCSICVCERLFVCLCVRDMNTCLPTHATQRQNTQTHTDTSYHVTNTRIEDRHIIHEHLGEPKNRFCSLHGSLQTIPANNTNVWKEADDAAARQCVEHDVEVFEAAQGVSFELRPAVCVCVCRCIFRQLSQFLSLSQIHVERERVRAPVIAQTH